MLGGRQLFFLVLYPVLIIVPLGKKSVDMTCLVFPVS